MILVILIPAALVALMIGSMAAYENNLESLRFWRPLNTGLCLAIALLSLTTTAPLVSFSLGVAAAMVLILLSDMARKPAHKGALYRAGMMIVFVTAAAVQPDPTEYLPAVVIGGILAAGLLVSIFSRFSNAPAAAQGVTMAVFTLTGAGLISLIPSVMGGSVPLLAAAAGMLVIHGIERVYFPQGFVRGARSSEMTAMAAHMLIAITAGMIGIESGWTALL